MMRTILKGGLAVVLLLALCLGGPAFPPFSRAEEAGTAEFCIQGYDNNSGDYIISALSVADFGAVGDGKHDDTQAFQSALEAANDRGGGVVYVPAGLYKISSPLTVPPQTTLRGHWNNPSLGTTGEESILVVNYGGGSESGTAFLSLAGKSTVRDLKIYYQYQDAEAVTPFPYTVRASSYLCNIMNLTLVNAYQGIDCGFLYGGSAQFVENIYGTILKQGILFDHNYETSSISRVHFSSAYWNAYDGSDRETIAAYTRENALPISIGKADDVFLYEIELDGEDYDRGISFFVNPEATGQDNAYGITYKLHGAKVEEEEPEDIPGIIQADKIGGLADQPGHFPASDRYSSRAVIYNVRDYGAAGDGQTDDSAAILRAIQEADRAGGGVVFFPGGDYVIRQKITVKPNIELKGEWDGPYMYSPSRLLLFYGKDQPDEAMIELSNGAGLHGLLFALPELTPQDIRPFAWVVRGSGTGTYVEYCTPLNTYNAFDFSSNRCDDFLLRGSYGTALGCGLRVGGGTEVGRIEHVFFSYGPWWEDINRQDDGALSAWSNRNAVGYVFGDVSDLSALGVCAYGLSAGMQFVAEGEGIPENVRIIRALLDVPNAAYDLKLDAGNNIAIIGLSSPSVAGVCLGVGESFGGTARIYGQNMWGGNWVQKNELNGKDVEIYREGDEDVELISYRFPFDPPNTLSPLAVTGIVVGSAVFAALLGLAILVVVRKKEIGRKKG